LILGPSNLFICEVIKNIVIAQRVFSIIHGLDPWIKSRVFAQSINLIIIDCFYSFSIECGLLLDLFDGIECDTKSIECKVSAVDIDFLHDYVHLIQGHIGFHEIRSVLKLVPNAETIVVQSCDFIRNIICLRLLEIKLLLIIDHLLCGLVSFIEKISLDIKIHVPSITALILSRTQGLIVITWKRISNLKVSCTLIIELTRNLSPSIRFMLLDGDLILNRITQVQIDRSWEKEEQKGKHHGHDESYNEHC
jgi:hypothetical protein